MKAIPIAIMAAALGVSASAQRTTQIDEPTYQWIFTSHLAQSSAQFDAWKKSRGGMRPAEFAVLEMIVDDHIEQCKIALKRYNERKITREQADAYRDKLAALISSLQ